MGHTKTELHPPYRNHQSNLFKALGHPARMAIVEFLVKNKSGLGQDLIERTQLAQSSFAQHMRMLMHYELITTLYNGKVLHYQLNNDLLDSVWSQIHAWRLRYDPQPKL